MPRIPLQAVQNQNQDDTLVIQTSNHDYHDQQREIIRDKYIYKTIQKKNSKISTDANDQSTIPQKGEHWSGLPSHRTHPLMHWYERHRHGGCSRCANVLVPSRYFHSHSRSIGVLAARYSPKQKLLGSTS
eukprot:3003367-Amphidinium_carterae.1